MSPAGVSSRRRVTDCPKMTPRVRSGRRVLTTHQNFVLGQPIYEPVRPIQELMPIQALQRSLDITAQSPSKRPLQSGTLLKTKSVGTETLNRHCKLPPSRHLVGEKCESLGALTYRRPRLSIDNRLDNRRELPPTMYMSAVKSRNNLMQLFVCQNDESNIADARMLNSKSPLKEKSDVEDSCDPPEFQKNEMGQPTRKTSRKNVSAASRVLRDARVTR